MATIGHSSWGMDDIDDALAADFDGSLSGLGIELGTASFNMSETLLALPSLKNGSVALGHPGTAQRIKKNRPLQAEEEAAPTTIKRFCNDPNQQSQKHSTSAPDLRHCSDGLLVMQPPPLTSGNAQSISPSGCSSSSTSVGVVPTTNPGCSFQCVLGAATSIATKVNERTMTYLNQGQSYEIKLKKLGDLTDLQGKLMKSIVRVGFQERRLQYMEREQMDQWSSQHPQERVLDVDIPLSYGVFDVVTNPKNINSFEFMWDPTKETGVFVRLNCISTEFTPKKHGGEKGVPFRLVVETYSHDAGTQNQLHTASCQVKVFKPKGADRKHKTDREKMSKRPIGEQELYQPSFDCTFFTEGTPQSSHTVADTSLKHEQSPIVAFPSSPEAVPQIPVAATIVNTQCVSLSPSNSFAGSDSEESTPLSIDANVQETSEWLRSSRFSAVLPSLGSFSASDLLRLSKADLVTICGVAEGIRLYNILHLKPLRPALTLYIGSNLDEPFLPLFLPKASCYHLKNAVSAALNSSCEALYVRGPRGIQISVTDELVRNLSDESAFTVEAHEKSIVLVPSRENDP